VTRLLIAAYLVEAGLLLAVAPWTGFWDRNYAAQAWPAIGALMLDPFVRGAITGVGVITMVAGLRDLASALVPRNGTTTGKPGGGDTP